MRIVGGNLEEREVEFKNLIEYAEIGTPFYDVMKYLQNFYYDCCNKVLNSNVNMMPIEDGKVVIKPMMVNHRCRGDIDIVSEISKRGLLASEWFGVLESEGEGRFCTFLDRIKPDSYVYAKDENFRRLNDREQGLVLFFDQDNPVMKKLLDLDFFEYQIIKEKTPEKLKELYSEDEIKLLDVIHDFSKASFDFHYSSDRPYYYWSAIPGGIPSLLINGICIKLDNYDDEYLDKLNNLFPNAVLFDGMRNIIRTPKNNSDDFKHIK